MPPKTTKTGTPRSTDKYVRNLTRAQVVLRITGDEARRAVLNPRGQRGDLHFVTAAEVKQLHDTGVLYEIITETEGKEILSKQTTNQQKYHPAISMLRNEFGDKYEKAVTMSTQEEAQGYTVAKVEVKENRKDVEVERIHTKAVMPPTQVTRPGSVGYEATHIGPTGVGEAVHSEPSPGNPAEELGIKSIVVEPVQKQAR